MWCDVFLQCLPSDVSKEEWALVAPYLPLRPETASQREQSLWEVSNELRYVVRFGEGWRAIPSDLPLWHAVYEQVQHWLRANCFESFVYDLRAVLLDLGPCRRTFSRYTRRPDATLDARYWWPRREGRR